MHAIQQQLLNLAQSADLSKIGLRRLGAQVGESHPQKIKHHLQQLEKKGYLKLEKDAIGNVTLQPAQWQASEFFSLPILGMASCGPATALAEQKFDGYLKVSPAMIGGKKPNGWFVVKASGESLNQAKNLKGGPVDDGDFVVVNSKRQPENGDYVLSVIDDAANLKRFYFDKSGHQIALVSESALDIPPIYVHEDDFKSYMVNGVVEQVIKKIKL
jgi:repressor LexA